MKDRIRIGLSSDFVNFNADKIVEPMLDEIFGPLPQIEYEFFKKQGEVVAPHEIKDYDVLIILTYRFTTDSFKGVDRLATIARWGVGYDNISAPACTEADVLLSITTDSVRRPMAESIFTFFFALSRKLLQKDKLARTGRWDLRATTSGVGLKGQVFGLVGLGNIGSEVFRLLRCFEPKRMLACDPYATQEHAAELGVELVDLPTVFKESDFLTVICPLNDETRGMIGAELLSLMKPTAYFINAARGGIVKEAELITILQEGKIAGAGIDVFEQEPTPADNPLFKLDNVIVTPHAIAWGDDVYGTNTVDSCDNILAVLHGEIPKYTVNKQVAERPGFQAKQQSLRERWAALDR
jgi:phosphoglycerate dehydrogenase-like enzyme